MSDPTAHLLELALAQRDEAVRYVKALLAERKGNEFSWPGAQATSRGAAALVAEIEGGGKDPRDGVASRLLYGDGLRGLRKSRGITLGQAADALGLRTSTLSDVELGRQPPFDSAMLRSVVALLGLSDGEVAMLDADAELWTERP